MSLLTVRGLTKRYNGNTAVKGISFDIEEGHCVALLGPNGAGKTTTLKMLSGLLAPTDGAITFNVQGKNKASDIREWIGYLPQYPAFFSWMSGNEYMEFVGRLAGLSAKEARSRTKELLERVGLTDAAKRRVGGYSGGMKQRLGLAQAMIHRPKLIILDEPVSALDPLGRREVLELMRESKKETTILFSTHVLHDAEEISDDVLIIRSGEIAIQGSLSDIKRDHQQPVIFIQTESPQEAWEAELSARPYIETVEHENGALKLVVNDLTRAKSELLKEIVDRQISVIRFEVGRTTLEDLFMKAVMS